METELLQLEPISRTDETDGAEPSSNGQFIEANTSPINQNDLKGGCIIPSFTDNESTISHSHFIEALYEAAQMAFERETISDPVVRVSHPVKGRIPSAMGKPAKLLKEHEKTLYYERMAFLFEIPSIRDSVGGNGLSLTVGGVRSYSGTNLYSKKSDERFKIFVGYKNMVCTNLCISTDGYIGELKVRSISEIVNEALKLFGNYDPSENIQVFNDMTQDSLTERQFATLVGRSRMFQYLPARVKKELPNMPLLDSQVSMICKDYYSDESFCRNESGDIDLWRLYNLFTGASKSSYIDSFLDRGVGSHSFVNGLQNALKSDSDHWFVS
jgi:hypothetical protein